MATDKKIEDYLNLYLGCELLYKYSGTWTKEEGENNFTKSMRRLDYRTMQDVEEKRIEIKPILRPLSDMLNTEAFEIHKMYFGTETTLDFTGDTGSAYFNPKTVKVTTYHALRIINGEDYEIGDFMKVVSIVPYLLSKHFDLFGLIEAGLAIDKITLK